VKLLAIHGSPRTNGSSSAIHRAFTEPFIAAGAVIKEIHVYEKRILPCTACGACRESFSCPLNDDMSAIYTLINDADVISISTPLYFSSFPSQLKALMDRCQVFWEIGNAGHISGINKKHAAIICTAGSSYSNMFSGVLLSMKHFFKTINAVFYENEAILVPDLDTGNKISLEIIDRASTLSEGIIAHSMK